MYRQFVSLWPRPLLSHVANETVQMNRIITSALVVVWYSAGLVTARSQVRIPPAAAVYQRQLSMPSLTDQLVTTSDSWGVNGHTP